MNSVNIIGRIATEIRIGETKNKEPVMNFRIAYDGGLKEKPASFFRVTVFGDYIELYDNLYKGQAIGIQGRLRQRVYEASEDEKVEIVEIVASKIDILEWKEKKKRRKYDNTEKIKEIEKEY